MKRTPDSPTPASVRSGAPARYSPRRFFPGCAFLLLAGLAAVPPTHGDEADSNRWNSAWREDFSKLDPSWEFKGKLGTARTEFEVRTVKEPDGREASVLMAHAKQASGSLCRALDGLDISTNSILRWRWRVIQLPEGADGRDKKRDDQAAGLYVMTGGLFNQKAVAYRWETVTPMGHEGRVSYGGGVLEVYWFAIRNGDDVKAGRFQDESRDVAADFQKAFGFVPRKVWVGISCNSQYTGSRAESEFDWIEFGRGGGRTSESGNAKPAIP